MARRDVSFAFRITFQRLEGVPANSGPYAIKFRRGDKRKGEVAAKPADASGQVVFDTSFEVDGTLQSIGGNKYRSKPLFFLLEEVRDGRPHRCGEAKLNLADCMPFGHPTERYLAFGPCLGVVGLVGRPASDPPGAQVEIPDAVKLQERLRAAEGQLRAAEGERAALQKQLKEKEAEAAQRREEAAALQRQLEAQGAETEDSGVRLRELEAAARERATERGRLEAELTTLRRRLAAWEEGGDPEQEQLQARLAAAEREAEAGRRRIAELEREAAARPTPNGIQLQEAEAGAHQTEELEEALEEALQQAHEAKAEAGRQRALVAELEAELQTAAEAQRSLEEALAQRTPAGPAPSSAKKVRRRRTDDEEDDSSESEGEGEGRRGEAREVSQKEAYLRRIYLLEREVQGKAERCRRVEELLVQLQQDVTTGAPRDVYLQAIRQLKAEVGRAAQPEDWTLDGQVAQQAVARHLQRIQELEALIEEKEERQRRREEQAEDHIGDLQLRLEETERALRLQREECLSLKQRLDGMAESPGVDSAAAIAVLEGQLAEQQAEIDRLTASLSGADGPWDQRPAPELEAAIREELQAVQQHLQRMGPQARQWQELGERLQQKTKEYAALQGRVSALKRVLGQPEEPPPGPEDGWSAASPAPSEPPGGQTGRFQHCQELLDQLEPLLLDDAVPLPHRTAAQPLLRQLRAAAGPGPGDGAAPTEQERRVEAALQTAAARIVALQVRLSEAQDEPGRPPARRESGAAPAASPAGVVEAEEAAARAALLSALPAEWWAGVQRWARELLIVSANTALLAAPVQPPRASADDQVHEVEGNLRQRLGDLHAQEAAARQQVAEAVARLADLEGRLQSSQAAVAAAEAELTRLQPALQAGRAAEAAAASAQQAELLSLRRRVDHLLWGASLPSVPFEPVGDEVPEALLGTGAVAVELAAARAEVVELRQALALKAEHCAVAQAIQEEQALHIEEVESLLRRSRERLREMEREVEELEDQLIAHGGTPRQQSNSPKGADVQGLAAVVPRAPCSDVGVQTQAPAPAVGSPVSGSPLLPGGGRPWPAAEPAAGAAEVQAQWQADAALRAASGAPGLLPRLAVGGLAARPRTTGCVAAAVLLDGQDGPPETWRVAGNALLFNVVMSLQQSSTAVQGGDPDEAGRWLSSTLHFLTVITAAAATSATALLPPTLGTAPAPSRRPLPAGAEGLAFIGGKLLPLVQTAYSRTVGAAVRRFTRALDGCVAAPIAAAVAARESQAVQWEPLHDVLAELTDDLQRWEAPALLWHTAAQHLAAATDAALLALTLRAAPVLSNPQGGLELKMAVGRVEALLSGDGPHRLARNIPAGALPPGMDRPKAQLRLCRQACDVLILPKFDLLVPDLRASICGGLSGGQLFHLVAHYRAEDEGEGLEDVVARLRPALALPPDGSAPLEPAVPTPHWPLWHLENARSEASSPTLPPPNPTAPPPPVPGPGPGPGPADGEVARLAAALQAAEARLQHGDATQAELQAQVEEVESMLRRSRERLWEVEAEAEELRSQASRWTAAEAKSGDPRRYSMSDGSAAAAGAANGDSEGPWFQFSREMGLLQGLGLGQGPGGPKASGLLLAVALLEWHALSPEQWRPPGNTLALNLTATLVHAYHAAAQAGPADLLRWLSKALHLLGVLVHAVPTSRMAKALAPTFKPGDSEPPPLPTVGNPMPYAPPATPVVQPAASPSDLVAPAALAALLGPVLPLLGEAYRRAVGPHVEQFTAGLHPHVVAPLAASAPKQEEPAFEWAPLQAALAELAAALEAAEAPPGLWHAAAVHLHRATDAALLGHTLREAAALSSTHGGIQLKMAVGRVEALLGGDGPGKVARATPAAALPPAAERLGTQLRACRQVCDVLMLPKADLLQAELRASICPDLTDRQVHWLLRAYQADELLDPASEVLAKLALEVSSTESPPPPALPTPVWGPPPSKADDDHELGGAAEPDFGTEEVAVDLVALQRYLTAVYANVSIPTLVPPLGPMALLPSAAPPLWD